MDGDIPRRRKADLKVRAQLATRARGEWHDAGLMELGLTDAERSVHKVSVGVCEASEFAAAHPRGVQQNDRDAVRRLVQRVLGMRSPGLDGVQHPPDLARAEDHWSDRGTPLREIQGVRNEARRLSAASVEAELTDDQRIAPASARARMLMTAQPGLEPIGVEIAPLPLCEETRQTPDNPAGVAEELAERALVADIAYGSPLKCRVWNNEAHD